MNMSVYTELHSSFIHTPRPTDLNNGEFKWQVRDSSVGQAFVDFEKGAKCIGIDVSVSILVLYCGLLFRLEYRFRLRKQEEDSMGEKIRSFLRVLGIGLGMSCVGVLLGLWWGYQLWYTAPLPPMPGLVAELQVEAVADGDTVKVRFGEELLTIRLMGVDTPETRRRKKRDKQCFADKAKEKTETLIGKTLRFEFIAPDPPAVKRDQFQRALAYIHLPNGTLFNEQLIREGFAHQFTPRGEYKYQEQFLAAEAEAKKLGRGMWKDPNCAAQSTRTRSR